MSINGSSREVDCCICWDSYPDSSMRGLLDCPDNHLVCETCMTQYLTGLITDSSTVNQITCPASGCKAVPAPYEIEALVPAEIYQKYLEFTVLDSLKKEKGVRWCPNKECQQPIVWEETTPTVVCPACKTRFCYHCSKDHPHTISCEDAQKEAAKTTIGGDGEGEKVDADASYAKWKEGLGKKVKPCPGCRMDVEKNMGCQHMTCSNCQHQWCWLCSGQYSASHFHGEASLCNGLQFSAYDSLEEALMATGRSAEQVAEQIRREEIERPIREAAERARQRRKRIRKGIIWAVCSPVLILGGVLVVAGFVLILPFIGVGALIC